MTRDRVELLALIVLAALVRLPGLATRGTWDRDQGHDMLVLRALVRSGEFPLLGPPTSIGDVHHGALYYYLLSPAALLTGGDSPLAVATLIALAGIAAVGVTWWLARSMAGPVAGLVAGLVMATSAAAIEESTFIWNPNLIAFSSAIALAGAWRAWDARRPRWWLLAGLGTAVTMQCHILGVVLLPVVAALFVADLRRRTDPAGRRRLRRAGLGALAIIAVSWTPLIIHELTSGFGETTAALDYLRAGSPSALDPLTRLSVVLVRVASWPLAGLITDAPLAAFAATGLVLGVVAWRRRDIGVRWLGLGIVWSAVSLTIAASSLATVTPGLPNDHYHAFVDPMVVTLIGIGTAAAWRTRSIAVTSMVIVATIVGWNALHLPAFDHPDGGFPAAERAAVRIGETVGERALVLASLPAFKSADAYEYPLVRDGRRVVASDDAAAVVLVVVCDGLYEEAIGAPCGGPAEDRVYGQPNRVARLADRFEAAPGRWISVYVGREGEASP